VNHKLSFSETSTRHWDPLSLLFYRHRVPLQRVERPGPDVNCSPPSSVEVQNKWSYAQRPFLCLHAGPPKAGSGPREKKLSGPPVMADWLKILTLNRQD
jgi:hypothetical protein